MSRLTALLSATVIFLIAWAYLRDGDPEAPRSLGPAGDEVLVESEPAADPGHAGQDLASPTPEDGDVAPSGGTTEPPNRAIPARVPSPPP